MGMLPRSGWGLHSHSIAIAIGLEAGHAVVAVAGLGHMSPFAAPAGRMHTIVAAMGVVAVGRVDAGTVAIVGPLLGAAGIVAVVVASQAAMFGVLAISPALAAGPMTSVPG